MKVRLLLIQYLGPARQVGDLRDEDPVGCDEILNHGDGRNLEGNVLREAGHVERHCGDDWSSLITTRRCIP